MNTDREQVLRELETEHGIRGDQIYLLEVIPLIEMIWADGKAQGAEVDILYRFVSDQVHAYRRDVEDHDFLPDAQVHAFLERFLNERPSPRLLAALRKLSGAMVAAGADPETNVRRATTVLEFCLDIAAASVTHYPYGQRERFMEMEKRILHELMETFDISPTEHCA